MRVSRPARLVVAATAAAALLAGMAVGSARAAALGAVAAGRPAERPAATTYSTEGQLTGVAAASASNAWAVGAAGSDASGKVLMLHWNGKAWSRVTSPKVLDGTAGELSAITVVSAADAWAVGVTGTAGSGKDHTLLLHWNGKAWSQVTSPAPVAGGNLAAVTATAKSGWAVGYVNTNPDAPACCAGTPLIFRLTGSKWSRVSEKLGNGAGLNGVAVTGTSTAWAIGMPTAMITGALARWNGRAWSWVGSYPVQGAYQPLEGIAAGPGGTAFAVGENNNSPGPAISMRWTGKAWQKVTVKAPSASQLNAVTFAPGGAAWAAGSADFGTAGPLIVRWSGKAWTRVASPSPRRNTVLSGLGFAAAGYGWAVGAAPTGLNTSATVILHWNGKVWS